MATKLQMWEYDLPRELLHKFAVMQRFGKRMKRVV